LKKQLKDLKYELKDRIEENESLKKTVKYSKIQEVEAEMKAYADETVRLKFLLEQAMQASQQNEL
jgi:hypothetical protein